MALPRTYTVTDMRHAFGVTARALRHYEAKGLLAPARQDMARLYSARDRARLALILDGRRAGFKLAEIRDWLDLYDQDEAHLTQMATSVAKFRRRIAELEVQKRDLDRAAESLRTACGAIEARLGALRPDLLRQSLEAAQGPPA